jgi:hypothetical protein
VRDLFTTRVCLGVTTASHVDMVLVLGDLPLAQVRNSHIRGWVKDRLPHLAPSTMAVVFHGTLVPMFSAAVVDRRIGVSSCAGVRLPEIPDAMYCIARPEQVHALAEALPERYRAIVYLAAGCGWRGGEIFGLEREAIDFDGREIHVRHQLTVIAGRSPHLARPKTKTSVRTNELPVIVADALRAHLKIVRPCPEDIEDETDPRRPIVRPAQLVSPAATADRSTGPTGPTSGGRPFSKPACPLVTACATYGITSPRCSSTAAPTSRACSSRWVTPRRRSRSTPTSGTGRTPSTETRSLVDSALGGAGVVPGGTAQAKRRESERMRQQ